MPDKVVRDKVVCYIVREGKLLVFRHIDYPWEEVGVQQATPWHGNHAGRRGN